MVIKQSRLCPNCKKAVNVDKHVPNHLFHLTLTCLTGGVWVLFWIITTSVYADISFQCPNCKINFK